MAAVLRWLLIASELISERGAAQRRARRSARCGRPTGARCGTRRRPRNLSPGKHVAVLAGVNPKNLMLTAAAGAGLAQLGLSSIDAVVSLIVFALGVIRSG